jgi:hypothetical protein
MPISRGRRAKPAQSLPQNHLPANRADKLCRVLPRKLRSLLGTITGAVWDCVRPYFRPRRLFRVSVLILTIAASALFFLPRVIVDVSGPYDPSHPSPVLFTISNINIVPLRNVWVFVGLCYLAAPNAIRPPDCNGSSGPRFIRWKITWLDTDEKFQVPMEEVIRLSNGQQFEKADITVGIIYTPWRMPSFWRIAKEFRFVTETLSDGRIYWIPTPLNR